MPFMTTLVAASVGASLAYAGNTLMWLASPVPAADAGMPITDVTQPHAIATGTTKVARSAWRGIVEPAGSKLGTLSASPWLG